LTDNSAAGSVMIFGSGVASPHLRTPDLWFQNLGGGVWARLKSDGVRLAIMDAAGTGYVDFSGGNAYFTSLHSSVGGGFVHIGLADFTGVTFAALGLPPNGSFVYCTDCTIADPCAAAGSGAFAKRLNGVWVCN